jgi:4-hydroxy-tetrahydrodipicolinate synthase
MPFAGVHTALVTPFRDGAIDEDALRRLIDRQFEARVAGVVPVGTTGESPTLSHREHERVVELAVGFAAGRGQVIAGTGSNSTAEAIALTRAAEAAGATATLQVCPYYNKPSQEGLYQHFKAVAASTALPVMLYSIPGRCGVEIAIETVARLAHDCPTVVAIKEAGGNPDRVTQLVAACPDGFEVLSGDDSLTLPFMAVGAVGVVSVASNLIPSEMVHLVAAALQGKWEGGARVHRRFAPLFSAFLKLDTNPVPIKTALEIAGLCHGELRLPLVPMAREARASLEVTLRELGLAG